MQSQESLGARAAFALDIPLISISYVLLALIALMPRVLSLGSFVTVDEIAFWIPRADVFLRAIQAGDFPATAISSHPGVTTMWLGSAGTVLRRALLTAGLLHDDSFATVLAFYRLPVALAHTAGILVGYALLRRMLPALVAALAALLWAADPFVIAYSRVLHVDGLAGTFITLSLLAACLYWFHDRRSRFLILSAISAGLAILSKSPALVLLPLVGLVAIAGASDEGRRTKDERQQCQIEPAHRSRECRFQPYSLRRWSLVFRPRAAQPQPRCSRHTRTSRRSPMYPRRIARAPYTRVARARPSRRWTHPPRHSAHHSAQRYARMRSPPADSCDRGRQHRHHMCRHPAS
jgi:Dolichyl-phosphate-mannose-protein mannosyltransferase